MAIDFPSSPSINDTFTSGEKTWKWDGNVWRSVGVPIGGVSGSMEFVGEAEITGGAATTLVISGLDLTADGRYFIEIELVGASGTPTIAMTYNADTTATNYDVQVAEVAGGSAGQARANNAILLTTVTTDTTSIEGWLRINSEGNPRFVYRYSSGDTTAIKTGYGVHTWRTASTNITSLTLTSSVASALGIGSRIRVWKMTEVSSVAPTSPGGSSGPLTVDTIPASPNASDDEFESTSLNTALWQYGTAWNVGSVAYEGQSQGAYVIRLDPSATANEKAYAQSHAGSVYKYRAKVRLYTVDADGDALDDPTQYARVEIFVATSSNNKRVSCVIERNAATWTIGVRRTTGATYNSGVTYIATQIVNGMPGFGLYLEIEDDGSNHYYRASTSGHDGTFATFRQESRTTHLDGTADRVGFCVCGSSATHTIAGVIEWFRRIS